jgi:hypothetical protein
MKILKLILVMLLTITCSVALAQGNQGQSDVPAPSLVPCSGATTGSWTCGVTQFFELIRRLIRFFAFDLAIPAAAIGIAYSGIEMVTKPNNPGARKQAIETIEMIVIGLIWVLGAWLIVHTLVDYVVKDGAVRNVLE